MPWLMLKDLDLSSRGTYHIAESGTRGNSLVQRRPTEAKLFTTF